MHTSRKLGTIESEKAFLSQGDRVRTVDLFCGAGLSSSGARAAGAEIVCGVDLDSIASMTYGSNFPDATVLNKRLEEIDPRKLKRRIGRVDLLLASPECTNHTCAKGSAPRSEASRATAMQTLRYAQSLAPRWIVIENVVHMKPWGRYPELLSGLQSLGYYINEQILDASEFGVPQKRRRLFIVCDKEKRPAPISPANKAQARTAADILDRDGEWKMSRLFKKGRAPDTKKRAKRAIAELGDGAPFLIVYYGTDGSGGWQSLDRPLRTVTTVDRFALCKSSVDGYWMRMLQVPELMRAMGLPETYRVEWGTRRDKIRLLGNGVCPPVMTAIVSSLVAAG